MLRRVVARNFGVVGHAQTLSRGSFQLVLRGGKHAPFFPCIVTSTRSSGCQTRFLSYTRSHAAEGQIIVEEAPVEILVTPKKQTRAKKPAAAKTTSTKTTRKPGPKSTAKDSASKVGRSKKKAAPKKKSPAAKKKPVVKKKPVAKKKLGRPRKPLTPLAAYAAKIKQLRKQALLTMPKLLPMSGYFVYTVEHAVKGTTVTESAKINIANYRGLSLSEREHYDNMAKQNQVENVKTTQRWIESHTPDEIRLANLARREINRIAKAPVIEGRKVRGISRVKLIKDARAVKLAHSPFIIFTRERWASGDFKGHNASSAIKAISAEWKVLGEADKKKYEDASIENRALYREQYNAIFTRGKRSPPKSAIKPIAE